MFACPSGTANPALGSIDDKACQRCSLGTVASTAGLGNCAPCEAGKFQNDEGKTACKDCMKGTFIDVESAGGCKACPLYASTAAEGTVSSTDCGCTNGFIELLSNGIDKSGGFECICPAGKERKGDADGGVSCKPCDLGMYKANAGNDLCVKCPLLESTTPSVGATSSEQCVCNPNFFMGPPSGGVESGVESGVERGVSAVDGNASSAVPDTHGIGICIPCSEFEGHELGGVQCNESGVELEAVPIVADFWRQSPASRTARPCFTQGVCGGGTSVAQQCIEGHTGPYCAVCAFGYHGGGDGTICERCPDDPGRTTLTIAVSAACFGGAVLLLVLFVFLYATGQCGGLKRARLAATGMLKTCNARLGAKIAKMQVKLKIILGLYQILNGIGMTFRISYPPFYTEILSSLSSVVDVNLIQTVPFGCMVALRFAHQLFFRTVWPLTLIGLLLLLSRAMHNRAKALTDQCATIAFIIIFLVYPGCSQALFTYLNCDALDGDGEDGTAYMRVDLAVDCATPLYTNWHVRSGKKPALLPVPMLSERSRVLSIPDHGRGRLYFLVAPMLLVYPVGVPMFYTLLFYKHRHALREMQRAEMRSVVEAKRATLLEKKQWRDSAVAMSKSSADAHEEAFAIKESLPPMVRKLMVGYHLKCYWFEVFECIRKILLIGIPVLFRPGSTIQLVLGLIISFVTFGMYAAKTTPRRDPHLDPAHL